MRGTNTYEVKQELGGGCIVVRVRVLDIQRHDGDLVDQRGVELHDDPRPREDLLRLEQQESTAALDVLQQQPQVI